MFTRIFSLSLPFTAGLMAAFNPCGVILLPAYVVYIIGKGKRRKNDKIIDLFLSGLKAGISMTAGFISVFTLLGILISVLGRSMLRYAPWMAVLIGVLFFIYGLGLLLYPEKLEVGLNFNIQLENKKRGVFTSLYIYGISYALASIGCILPIFLTVILTTFTSDSFFEGLINFIAFSLGMGLMVTIISILAFLMRDLILRWLKKIVPYMHTIVALFLIITGIYLLYYWFRGSGLLQL
ncbi:MAG: cytochrome c biogenesis CcdA family protein [Bacillota bacterium]